MPLRQTLPSSSRYAMTFIGQFLYAWFLFVRDRVAKRHDRVILFAHPLACFAIPAVLALLIASNWGFVREDEISTTWLIASSIVFVGSWLIFAPLIVVRMAWQLRHSCSSSGVRLLDYDEPANRATLAILTSFTGMALFALFNVVCFVNPLLSITYAGLVTMTATAIVLTAGYMETTHAAGKDFDIPGASRLGGTVTM